MPRYAKFCKVLSAFPGILFFLQITTLFAKYGKTMQFNAVCSSQIVVKILMFDYSDFLGSFEPTLFALGSPWVQGGFICSCGGCII